MMQDRKIQMEIENERRLEEERGLNERQGR